MARPYEHILYEVERGRARITLNQPKRRNPLTARLLEELVDALWEADDDRSVHCVILRANGPAFCAGYDLAPPRVDNDDGIDRRTGPLSADSLAPLELDQIVERLAWTPAERLRYLLDMLAFEEKAHQAKPWSSRPNSVWIKVS